MNGYSDQLTISLNMMSQEPIQLPPADYQDPLVSEIVELVVKGFAQRSTGIHHLQLHNSESDFAFRHFQQPVGGFLWWLSSPPCIEEVEMQQTGIYV